MLKFFKRIAYFIPRWFDFLKQKKLIFNFFVNRNWKKLTDSRKWAKILADNRKSHHPIETLSYWPIVFPIASNSPTSLCETKIDPVSFSFLKWRVCWPVLFQTHASLFGFLPAQVQSQDQPEIKKDSKIINHSNFYSVQGKRKLSSILWPDCKVLFSWPLSHIPHGISEWKKDRSGWGAKLAR